MAKKEQDPVKEAAQEAAAPETANEAPQQEAAEPVDPAAALEAELAAAKEAHIRTLAEYDNSRKRSTREKEAAYGDAKAAALKELLPVLDNFDRALAAPDADAETLRKGLEMISGNLWNILEKLGVEAFGKVGEPFDPNIHNAVMHTEDESKGENEIAAVFSKGYRLGERILRPAMVQVVN